EKIVEIQLNADEQKMFDDSVAAVKELLGSVNKAA
ncbi:MAG: malate dehydrogenase, partial [Pseudomonadota bacterium]|nr:malate dehydrogenase [Pseudomonadota bacterium]